jgi:4a-hydroxytetrahydrobiopterin dehydratase
MAELRNMDCIPCRRGDNPLSDEEIQINQQEIPEWEVIEIEGRKHLERRFKFKNFKQALNFTLGVGEIAESQDHHPVIITEWGKVTVQWWTHAINGLHKNDFIMAAKTDHVYNSKS